MMMMMMMDDDQDACRCARVSGCVDERGVVVDTGDDDD
jgi:hypothetical protein